MANVPNDDVVRIELGGAKNRTVLSITNNRETPNYRAVGLRVGEVVPFALINLMVMNPHRFKLTKKTKHWG